MKAAMPIEPARLLAQNIVGLPEKRDAALLKEVGR